MPFCHGIILTGKNRGRACTKEVPVHFQLCRVHHDSLLKHGPIENQRMDARARHYERTEDFLSRYKRGMIDYETYCQMINYVDERLHYMLEYADEQEVGIDYRQRHLERRRLDRIRYERERMLPHDEYQRPEQANPNQDIAAFSSDNQNVHTTIVVKQTTEMIQKIRSIPVPTEFQWNKDKCSKTPADIIMRCELTPDATFQMMSKYCSADTIYELEEGIYGKTLDCVWQFILNSDDKECLIKTIKQEMEDNIGMCAQGNLSRLCNILAGYVEGIGPVEAMNDVLGRLLPPLLEIPDVNTRIERGKKILSDAGVPRERWDDWLVGLID